MPIHTFPLVRRSGFSNFSLILLFVLVDVVVHDEVKADGFRGTLVASLDAIYRTVFE